MTKPKCVRRGCGKDQQEGSDLCRVHTKKYYDRWTRNPVVPDYGCGGGKRTPKVTGEGTYGSSFHAQHHEGEEDGN